MRTRRYCFIGQQPLRAVERLRARRNEVFARNDGGKTTDLKCGAASCHAALVN